MSFEIIEENHAKKDRRDSFSHYYVPNVEIKDFNVLIDGKSFFNLPVKNEEEITTTQFGIYLIFLISKKIGD